MNKLLIVCAAEVNEEKNMLTVLHFGASVQFSKQSINNYSRKGFKSTHTHTHTLLTRLALSMTSPRRLASYHLIRFGSWWTLAHTQHSDRQRPWISSSLSLCVVWFGVLPRLSVLSSLSLLLQLSLFASPHTSLSSPSSLYHSDT